MTKPLISVIIPAYNHEQFIGPTIESVLHQTWAQWELIVIDDGSTDGTASVTQSYNDPRIHYYYQKNQDAYNALNHGLQLVKGEFIAILNSDDLYHPSRLEHLVEFCQKSKLEACFSDVTPINELGTKITPDHFWHTWHERNRKVYFDSHDLFTAFLRGNLMVSTSNLFMTTKAMRQVGSFASLRYLHDYDYIFRLLLSFPGAVGYLDREELLSYRIHPSNTLKQGAITAREEDRDLIRKYMLQSLPESHRLHVATAVDRLIELEHELMSIQNRLQWGRWLPFVNILNRLLLRRRI